jgi:sterol desaturase/sphingolipid hydroxylase (fatty acid hydroxylase superfamily)
MAASDRRPAVWPWLVMPIIVLLVFYALHRVQHPPRTPAVPADAAARSPRQ